MTLRIGTWYWLSGMTPKMWTSGHPAYGMPPNLAGQYLGSLKGTRVWHGFEIRVLGEEKGVIFMTDIDLAQLDVTLL